MFEYAARETPTAGVVQAQGLTKRYGNRLALNNADVTALPGKITVLSGANGSGKSTLIKALLGLVTPTSGRALIDGVPYMSLDNPITVVGAVLDTPPPKTALSLERLMRLACLAARVTSELAGEQLQKVGLEQVRGLSPRELSRGQRQRFQIAVALLGNPRVLLLDEPSDGLDSEHRAWLLRFLADSSAAGATVLMATHQEEEVEALANVVYTFVDGSVSITRCS